MVNPVITHSCQLKLLPETWRLQGPISCLGAKRGARAVAFSDKRLRHRARNTECDRAAVTADASQALTANSPPPPAAPPPAAPPFSPRVSPADETSLLDSEFT